MSVATSLTLIEKQRVLTAEPSIAEAPATSGQEATPEPTPQTQETSAEGAFDLALRALAASYADNAISRGVSCHRPVPDDTLAAIAATVPGILDGLDRRPVYAHTLIIEDRIRRLPESDRELLAAALLLDPVKWRPCPGSQALAYELASKVDVLMLAGGAGSGKSEVALGIGMFQSRITRLVRRTSGEFTPMLRRISEVVGTIDGRNLSNNVWDLPAGYGFRERGCTFEWVGLNDQDAVLKLQGRPCDLLAIDDAASGQVTEADVIFARTWLRSVEQGLHKLLLLTANPPTSSTSLYLRDSWFAPWLSPSYAGTPARSGEVRYFDADNNEVPQGTEGAQSRAVVLSTVEDNPRLMHTGYDRQLDLTPDPVLRARMRTNSWVAGFDNDEDQQVLPGAWVQAAMDRWKPAAPSPLDALGVDVARGGKDRTVIANRCGDWFAVPVTLSGAATATGQQVAAVVLAARASAKHAITFIDATGVGASPYDILREKVPTVPIIFGAAYPGKDASQSFEFTNVRSALWWRFREALDPSNPRRIALPPDRVLKTELCMPRYELRGGRLFVESRDDIIKRLKRSPDVATAFVLALIPTNSTLATGANSSLRRAMQRFWTKE